MSRPVFTFWILRNTIHYQVWAFTMILRFSCLRGRRTQLLFVLSYPRFEGSLHSDFNGFVNFWSLIVLSMLSIIWLSLSSTSLTLPLRVAWRVVTSALIGAMAWLMVSVSWVTRNASVSASKQWTLSSESSKELAGVFWPVMSPFLGWPGLLTSGWEILLVILFMT